MPIPRQQVPPPPLDEFVRLSELVVIEVWARWSGTAFLVGETLDRFLRSREDLPIRVGRVDADANPDVGQRFRALPPVLLLFHHGVLVGRHEGLITVEGLSHWLDRVLSESKVASPDAAPEATHPSKENAS